MAVKKVKRIVHKSSFDEKFDRALEDLTKKYSVDRFKWMMKNKPLTIILAVFVLLTIIAVVWGYYAYGTGRAFNGIVLMGITLIFIPITILQYLEYSRIEQMENYFPNFLRDIADSRRAGVTLADAIGNSTQTYYASLSDEVVKMSNQLSWGVPFEDVLKRFAVRSKSNLIRRDIEMILEAYRAGGSIADILDAVTADTMKIKELQAETRSTLKVQLNTIYILYFTFLGIIVMLQSVLLPSLPSLTGISKIVGSAGSTVSLSEFNIFLLHFAFIQGFFIGLIAGEVSEGT
ncbi:MAG: type II secretion system F family protein, partial [Candidatus Diapherotrites archaeon]|nr:type II secretion system F family protein [Candidatus Diapherotrites archaeon]